MCTCDITNSKDTCLLLLALQVQLKYAQGYLESLTEQLAALQGGGVTIPPMPGSPVYTPPPAAAAAAAAGMQLGLQYVFERESVCNFCAGWCEFSGFQTHVPASSLVTIHSSPDAALQGRGVTIPLMHVYTPAAAAAGMAHGQ